MAAWMRMPVALDAAILKECPFRCGSRPFGRGFRPFRRAKRRLRQNRPVGCATEAPSASWARRAVPLKTDFVALGTRFVPLKTDFGSLRAPWSGRDFAVIFEVRAERACAFLQTSPIGELSVSARVNAKFVNGCARFCPAFACMSMDALRRPARVLFRQRRRRPLAAVRVGGQQQGGRRPGRP